MDFRQSQAVNPDVSISIPVLSSNGQRTTGMLKVLELRDQAESALGDLYDIKDFHTAIIGHGAMPLYILEEVVEKYITNMSNISAAN
ncbi:MAG: DUF885 domain-containing protein [Pseudomonadales bacterium]|nr:DUF885 domain-containing protein [Pseudomonadales bacterium]